MDIETPRHTDAFEFYFGLGGLRSYPAVAREFNVSKTSVVKWARAFNWKERCHVRDQLIAKNVSEQTTISTVNLKAKRLKEVSKIQEILDKVIHTAVDELERTKIKTKTPADIRALVSAKDQMIRVEQSLIGEDLADKDVKIRIKLDVND